MRRRVPFGRAGAFRPPHIADCHARRRELLQLGRQIAPGPHVPGLLLHPPQLLQTWVAGQHCPRLLPREGVELLQPHDGRPVRLQLLRLRQELVVNLPAAEHQARDLVGAARGRWVVEHGIPAAARQLLDP